MKLRTGLGWLITAGITLYVAAAYAQAPSSTVSTAIDELWTMVKAAGVLGSAVLVLALRAKQKEVDRADTRIATLTGKVEALHARYLEDTAKTREVVQEQIRTTSTLVQSIAEALAVSVNDRKEMARHDRERG